MPLNEDGTFEDDNVAAPLAWANEGFVFRGARNHIIPRETLVEFWNHLVPYACDNRQTVLISRYLKIVDAGEGNFNDAMYWRLSQMIGNGRVPVNDNAAGTFIPDDLIGPLQSVCEEIVWQRYNIFDGLTQVAEGNARGRPPGVMPIPPNVAQHLAAGAAGGFDFPIIIQEHAARGVHLALANGYMENFILNQADLELVFTNLTAVQNLQLIPAQDLNWFWLDPNHFGALTPDQRLLLFNECFADANWFNVGYRVYHRLFPELL